ncbi:MAG: VacJ family lipoprotein [Alphaproteobacteria bacterium]|nr:VacJ family lipoprotein [Alphaproteobacteria bacterium]MDA8001818.1 VacJ family lipoprotein [Alphaproteobacteria bacterium]MDA8004727.1 VacJ family lipoprotein [Alphaproteobacteria bacterium]MDA8005600.1 VacJ family lipoprotein [Alphaproteobacteria bacterium]MDA8012750.1 VacJ family lipoprotein [Alphaproteobacteria bacterium]
MSALIFSRILAAAPVFLGAFFAGILMFSPPPAFAQDASERIILAQNQGDDDDDEDFGALFGDGDAPEVSDPIEPVNRAFYKLNVGIDRVILTPATRVWDFIVPAPVDLVLGNFLSNLELPLSAANSLLQGDIRGTGITTMRFATNSTIGFLGFADPASSMGWYECEENFGQTLGRYGVGNGPYLVLPLLGPSHLREFTGDITEAALEPDILNHYLKEAKISEDGRDTIETSLMAVDIIQSRIEAREIIDYVRETSVDEYATVRTFYTQNSVEETGQSCSESVDEQRLASRDQ